MLHFWRESADWTFQIGHSSQEAKMTSPRTRSGLRTTAAVALAALFVLSAAPVSASDRYDPASAGHPLRIVGYVLHPIFVVLDKLIFHPAWRLSQWEPVGELVGAEQVLDSPAEGAEYAEDPPARLGPHGEERSGFGPPQGGSRD
jgi:hypothetical protein